MDSIGEPTLVTSLRLKRGEVTCASTAGTRLATGGGDGTLRLWTWHRDLTWVEQAEYPKAHRYGITGAKFVSSGLLLATVGVDGAARLWAVRDTLVVRRTLAAPDAAAARSLQWATSERLVVGHDDGGVRVWSIWSGALLAHVRPHEGAIYAIATPAAAALLLTACTDGVLKVFELDEIIAYGREGDVGPPPLLWEDGAHDLGALCAADCYGGAATGGHDGRVRVWRVAGAGAARRVAAGAVLAGHKAAVTALSWVADVLASASLDRTVRLWNSETAVCMRVLHAHSRYLTCVTLANDLRYMITASNDKSIRTWSLGNFSFNEDIEPQCNPLAHFGLGDLEGIGPVDDSESTEIERLEEGLVSTSLDIHCLARVSHVAAINAIAVSKDHIATACSDGFLRLFKWLKQDDITIELEFELAAHSYPVLAADFGSDGALLLSGGLDGCVRLWDVQTGCELAAVSAEGGGGGAGGGGVRDARLSPRRPPLLLVASDDGLAALWGIDPPSPDPLHVYTGLAEAAVCCAWAADGRVMAVGGEAGELLLLAAPPCAAALAQETDAHDLGVLSCDFAHSFQIHNIEESRKTYLLATGGRDASVKLWFVELEGFFEDSIEKGSLKLAKTIAAHGGAVQCVRWGVLGRYESELALATGGADRWARAWRVTARGRELDARAAAAVPAGAAGGAPAVRLLARGPTSLMTVGSLSGTLALWEIPHVDTLDETEGCEARAWGTEGVARWLKEYVTRPPGSSVPETEESRLMEAVREAGLSGSQLLDKPMKDLMLIFGYEEEPSDDSAGEVCEEARARLLDEILWLRRDPLSNELEARAPHALRCPLSHAALREPARAADGYTYERRSLLHWRLAAGDDELRSPMSGRRLRSARVEPNYGVREQLRQYCGWRQ